MPDNISAQEVQKHLDASLRAVAAIQTAAKRAAESAYATAEPVPGTPVPDLAPPAPQGG